MKCSAWFVLTMLLAEWCVCTADCWELSARRQAASWHATIQSICRVCQSKPQLTSPLYGPLLSRESLAGRRRDARVISNGTPRMPGFKHHFEPAQSPLSPVLKLFPLRLRRETHAKHTLDLALSLFVALCRRRGLNSRP